VLLDYHWKTISITEKKRIREREREMIIIPSKLLQAISILEVQHPFQPGLQETLSFLTML